MTRLVNDLKKIKDIIHYSPDDVARIQEWESEGYDCILYGVKGIVDRLYYDECVMSDDDYNQINAILDETDNPYKLLYNIDYSPNDCARDSA